MESMTHPSGPLRRLTKLIEPYGTSVQICYAKSGGEDPSANKHVLGHHVGSWSFRPLQRIAKPEKSDPTGAKFRSLG